MILDIQVCIVKVQSLIFIEAGDLEKTEGSGEAVRRSQAAERVLEAASELFYREGIRAVGVDTVVERSGVAKMTLYKHFGSKDELVAAYLRRREARWREWLTDAVESRADSPRERLLAVFDALGEWMAGDEFRGCASINATVELADPGHPARVAAKEYKEWMRSYLKRLAAEAGAGEPEEIAERMLILLDGATVTAVMQTSREPIRQAKAMAEAVLANP